MKIKICGLSRPADIEAVNRYQPDYAGFILNFPKSFRNITPEQAKQLHSMLSDSIPAVGVTVKDDVDTVSIHDKVGGSVGSALGVGAEV